MFAKFELHKINLIKQLFINFLKKNKAYEKFLNNFNKLNYEEKNKFKKAFYRSPEALVVLAFRWDETDEKYKYWYKLHTKWEIYIQRNNNTYKLLEKFLRKEKISMRSIKNLLWGVEGKSLIYATLTSTPYYFFIDNLKVYNYGFKILVKFHNKWYKFLKDTNVEVPNKFKNKLFLYKELFLGIINKR